MSTERRGDGCYIRYEAFSGWRAEVWLRPYQGEMLACTRWVNTKRQARIDAKRILGWKAKE